MNVTAEQIDSSGEWERHRDVLRVRAHYDRLGGNTKLPDAIDAALARIVELEAALAAYHGTGTKFIAKFQLGEARIGRSIYSDLCAAHDLAAPLLQQHRAGIGQAAGEEGTCETTE